MRWLGKLFCWFGHHDWRVVRVIKPHLYISHGMYLGCDLECWSCGHTSSWRKVERDVWASPFAGTGEEHPNRYCPCRVCKLAMEAP